MRRDWGGHVRINRRWESVAGTEKLVERIHQLRVSLERCRERREYCERQLSEFVKSADLSDPRQQRREKKLRADLERGESDVRSLEKQLDDLMD
jgi:uncharacterized protein (DUF342 family)